MAYSHTQKKENIPEIKIPRFKTDFAYRSIIFHKLRVSFEKKLKARFDHNISRIKSLIRKLLQKQFEDLASVKLYRKGKRWFLKILREASS